MSNRKRSRDISEEGRKSEVQLESWQHHKGRKMCRCRPTQTREKDVQ